MPNSDTIPEGILDFPETAAGLRKRYIFISSVLREQYGFPPCDLDILDVGCGTGRTITRPLALEKWGKVEGIDTDSGSIDYARKRDSAISNLCYESISLEKIGSESYDVVICSEVLEHLINYDDFFSHLVRILRADGLLFITVPNGYGPKEIQSYYWKKYFEGTKCYNFMRNSYIRLGLQAKDEEKTFLVEDCPHVIFFDWQTIGNLFKKYHLIQVKDDGRTFYSGSNLFGLLSLPGPRDLNSFLGSTLPRWMVSNWLFALKKVNNDG